MQIETIIPALRRGREAILALESMREYGRQAWIAKCAEDYRLLVSHCESELAA